MIFFLCVLCAKRGFIHLKKPYIYPIYMQILYTNMLDIVQYNKICYRVKCGWQIKSKWNQSV